MEAQPRSATEPPADALDQDQASRDDADTSADTSADPNATASPETTPTGAAVTFSAEGVRAGFVQCVPVALGVAAYGVVFGVVASEVGLSVAEATLMSATVLAGAAQLIAVQLWADPIPVGTVLVTTLVVNLRYVLMGASLRPWFGQLSPRAAYGSLFFTADENWALTLADLRSGSGRGAFLLGSGLAIWTFWVAATALGASAGGLVGDPASYGLDFVLTAIFLTLAVGLWEGRESVLPWASAAAVAVGGAAVLPGRWYILLGGLAASATEVLRRVR